MNHIIIVNSIEEILQAIQCGIDLLMVDLETIGKRERQIAWKTHLSDSDGISILECLDRDTVTELIVRTEPYFDNYGEHVRLLYNLGVRKFMLPYFSDAQTVGLMLHEIPRDCHVVLLFETIKSVMRFEEILELVGQRNFAVHVGLNDLSITLDVRENMFEPLLSGVLDYFCETMVNRKIDFGIGGIAQLGFNHGLYSPEFLLNTYKSKGANWVILNRAFKQWMATRESQEIINMVQSLR